MLSSGMLRCVALVRTEVSKERSASIIRVTRFGELGTMLAVTSNRRSLRRRDSVSTIVFLRSMRRLLVTANVFSRSPILVILIMEALRSSETSVLTRAKRRIIPEYGILHSHRRENLKSCFKLIVLMACCEDDIESILEHRRVYVLRRL
jgi:hypothetical protein